MSSHDPADLVDIMGAAVELGVHPNTIRERIYRGELPAQRFGARGKFLIRRGDLHALLRPVHPAADR